MTTQEQRAGEAVARGIDPDLWERLDVRVRRGDPVENLRFALAISIKKAEVAIAAYKAHLEAERAGKDKAAQALGRKGGKARAKALTPERRLEIACNAAAKRWWGP